MSINRKQGQKCELCHVSWFSQASLSSLLLLLEGNMGNVAEKCLSCEDYLKRHEHSFIAHGIWDFETCNKTCWQASRLKWQINNVNNYRRKVGLKELCLTG